MVEVFKTNVADVGYAKRIINEIHENFINYKANFDLDDCDRILRVECKTKFVDQASLISLVREFGYTAEVLPDELPFVSASAGTTHTKEMNKQ